MSFAKASYGFVAVTALLCVAPVGAQDSWSWPEKPQNLQVLPKDWPGERLRAPMTGFARALGVRCSHCHVGEPDAPLSSYDFASDDNPNKERAREMLRMLGSINDHLDKIEASGAEPVNMWCHTCHAGRPRPMRLSEQLNEIYRAEGLDTTLERYAELRERFYGRGAYDFGEPTLNAFGYRLLGEDNAEGAIRVFELNAELFPESANVWDSLAEAQMKAGSDELAQEYYYRSLGLDPGNENAKEMLAKLASAPGS